MNNNRTKQAATHTIDYCKKSSVKAFSEDAVCDVARGQTYLSELVQSCQATINTLCAVVDTIASPAQAHLAVESALNAQYGLRALDNVTSTYPISACPRYGNFEGVTG